MSSAVNRARTGERPTFGWARNCSLGRLASFSSLSSFSGNAATVVAIVRHASPAHIHVNRRVLMIIGCSSAPPVALRRFYGRRRAPASAIGDNTRMLRTETRAPIVSVNGPLPAHDTDLLVIPWFEDDAPGSVPDIDAASGGEVSRALTSREFTGKRFELFFAPLADRSWRA